MATLGANNKFINNIRNHYKSIMILRNNPDLLEKYDFAPYSLYHLHKQVHTGTQIQSDYNQLHPAYKYYNVLMKNEVPFYFLFANPQYIKNFVVYGKRIFDNKEN